MMSLSSSHGVCDLKEPRPLDACSPCKRTLEPFALPWTESFRAGPKARSAHTAVEHQGGLYLFGGEFT